MEDRANKSYPGDDQIRERIANSWIEDRAKNSRETFSTFLGCRQDSRRLHFRTCKILLMYSLLDYQEPSNGNGLFLDLLYFVFVLLASFFQTYINTLLSELHVCHCKIAQNIMKCSFLKIKPLNYGEGKGLSSNLGHGNKNFIDIKGGFFNHHSPMHTLSV